MDIERTAKQHTAINDTRALMRAENAPGATRALVLKANPNPDPNTNPNPTP